MSKVYRWYQFHIDFIEFAHVHFFKTKKYFSSGWHCRVLIKLLNFATKICHNKTNKKHGKMSHKNNKSVLLCTNVNWSNWQMFSFEHDLAHLKHKKVVKTTLNTNFYVHTLEKTLKKTIFLTRTLQLSNFYTQFSMKRSLIKFTRRMDQSLTLIWLIPFWRYFFTRCRWWINTRSRTGYRSSWI